MEHYPDDRNGARSSEPRIRTVAVHITGDPSPFVRCGADRYWIGIRGSVSAFLQAAADGTLAGWLETALATRRKVGLVTPQLVDRARFDQVVSAIADFSPMVDRVMTGDLGIATEVAGAMKTWWVGRVHNVDHASMLRRIGIHGVRAVCPVSTGAMDINREIDLEMPVFGRVPLAYLPDCDFRAVAVEQPVLHGRGGSILVGQGYLESFDFLDLSDGLRPFGRDTVGVVETSGLTVEEVAEAVDAIRFGRPVETTRPLFITEQ